MNQWRIPRDVETRLRRKFKRCVYCRRRFKRGVYNDRATIEHLNRRGPFYWPRLQERHVVIACGLCNSSRSDKRLVDWFKTAKCVSRSINANTVANCVKSIFGLLRRDGKAILARSCEADSVSLCERMKADCVFGIGKGDLSPPID